MPFGEEPVTKSPGRPGTPPPFHDKLSDAHRSIEEFGCSVLTGALGDEQRQAILNRLRDQAEAENKRGVSSRYLTFAHRSLTAGGPNQRVWNLTSKGVVFQHLALHPIAQQVTEHFLGPDSLLSIMSANISGPGCKPLHLHHDQGYLIDRVPGIASLTIVWMLTDFNNSNGATRVVPGSHKLEPGAKPPEGEDVIVEAPAGSALIMDGRIFHGTGPNTSDSHRYGIIAHYVLPFIRQQENFGVSMDDETEASLSPELRKLLGFRVWKALGAVSTPQEGDMVHRRYTRVGKLTSPEYSSPDSDL